MAQAHKDEQGGQGLKKRGEKGMDRSNYRTGVFKNSENRENKPLRYSKDSFVRELIGKVVKISLVNGKEIQGRLVELGMYDVLVQSTQGRFIIMKSAIVSVEVVQA